MLIEIPVHMLQSLFWLQSKEKSLSRICSPSFEVFSNPVDSRAPKRLGSIMLSQHANTETLIHHLNKYHENKFIEFMWDLLVIQTPNSLLEKNMSAVTISAR